jgi:hypothetical protein
MIGPEPKGCRGSMEPHQIRFFTVAYTFCRETERLFEHYTKQHGFRFRYELMGRLPGCARCQNQLLCLNTDRDDWHHAVDWYHDG